ncbi:MAG: NAD(P)-dependent oxidoreductase [Actinomycetota bacterium]|nr:NAD(P)-dependent oxidoreductase [Actinomycetota bacterium]
MTKVAFIGLGVMGYPMAGHLAAAGHDVTVHNRTTSVAQRWSTDHRGRSAATPAQAASGAEVVLTCVGNDDDVRAVVLGEEGALGAMADGAVLVDHTTASADLARELHAAGADRGVAVIDAPISGGQSGAEQGRLTVMCGGDPEPFERVRSVLAHYGAAVTLVGPSGAGQLTKMVNQLCIAGAVQGLSEGLAFGKRAGLDMDVVLDVIGKGAAGSWQMDNRGHTMVREEYDFGFAVDWMRKDLGICLAEARRVGARAPVAALVDQLYAQVQARGGNRWDTSSLIDLLLRD